MVSSRCRLFLLNGFHWNSFAVKRALGQGWPLALDFRWRLGSATGFLAFGITLGRGGVMPPFLSAWLANAIFALVGLFFFMGEE
jgi:hypothetical protein